MVQQQHHLQLLQLLGQSFVALQVTPTMVLSFLCRNDLPFDLLDGDVKAMMDQLLLLVLLLLVMMLSLCVLLVAVVDSSNEWKMMQQQQLVLALGPLVHAVAEHGQLDHLGQHGMHVSHHCHDHWRCFHQNHHHQQDDQQHHHYRHQPNHHLVGQLFSHLLLLVVHHRLHALPALVLHALLLVAVVFVVGFAEFFLPSFASLPPSI